jgi:hypothetical protein
MGKCYLTCGHLLKRIAWGVTMWEYDREMNLGKSYGVYCPTCYHKMKHWKSFIEGKRQNDW